MMDIPGFVDTHIHGAYGVDVSDADPEGIKLLSRSLRRDGVISFCPTTMTLAEDDIKRVFEAVSAAKAELEAEGGEYSEILGIHLEGPFLNPEMAGVQDSSVLKVPGEGAGLIESLEKDYPGLLKIIDIAPELPGGFEFIEEFSKRYVISLAHTTADYDTAHRAFEKGARSVTHLMNAMPPSLKRDPGILGAASEDNRIYCEVICDGIHISPPYLRMIFKLIDRKRLIVISDSMRGAHMPDGEYYLGSARVTVRKGRTFLGGNGGLAGSVTYMAAEAENLLKYGIPKEDVALACYSNPLERLNFMV